MEHKTIEIPKSLFESLYVFAETQDKTTDEIAEHILRQKLNSIFEQQ